MDSTPDASRTHPALFWGCLLFLNGALLLPSLVSYRPPASSWLLATDGAWPTSLIHRPEVDLLRISVDVVLLLALAALAARTPWRAAVRRSCVGIYMVLLAYVIYDAIIHTFFHRSGLLYEDIHFLVDAVYLTIDTLTVERALIGIGGILGGVALFSIVPRLFRTAVDGVRDPRNRRPALIAAVAVGLCAVVTLLTYGPEPRTATTSFVAAGIAENTRASLEEHQRMQALDETPIDSLYYTYDNLQLTDPPDIYLFMVESYGNVLATHPELQDSYYRLMRETESILASESWHMATGSRIHCRAGT